MSMKTAISIPDDLFDSADELARRMGMSRSRLYAEAVSEYVPKHRDQDVTRRLDEVYGEVDSGLPEAIRSAQGRSIDRSEW